MTAALAPGGAAEELRPAWVVVDLDALTDNLDRLRRRVHPARVLAVIKADAYGHGGPAVGRVLAESGVAWLGVALVEEGIELRRAGVEAPILVLGTAQPGQLPLYHRYRLTPTISSLSQLALWAEWGTGEGAEVSFHLKIDTGMTRLGIAVEELAEALARIRGSENLRLMGLLSHFADAEDLASPRNEEQERLFAKAVKRLSEEERGRAEIHLANSAGALHRAIGEQSLVRLGLSLFGFDPIGRETDLRPVMSVRGRIVLLREVAPGTRVGYGGRWAATCPSRVAVVPVGYGDGYPWRLTNRAEALVRGRRAPVVGSVTMDMIVVDVTGIEAREGDEVVLMGRQVGDEITAVELARRAGTIPYEILCLLGLRLPRRYRHRGREVEIDTRLGRVEGAE